MQMRLRNLLAAATLWIVTVPAWGGLISDTVHVEPFSSSTSHSLGFDFGSPLLSITAVSLTMDPCNAFLNELPSSCSDSIGTAEPVTVLIADLATVFVPADRDEIDLPLTTNLSLTATLLAELADGLITASASGAGSAAFVDFTLTVDTETVAVSEPLTLGLLGVGLLGLGFVRRRTR